MAFIMIDAGVQEKTGGDKKNPSGVRENVAALIQGGAMRQRSSSFGTRIELAPILSVYEVRNSTHPRLISSCRIVFAGWPGPGHETVAFLFSLLFILGKWYEHPQLVVRNLLAKSVSFTDPRKHGTSVRSK